MGNFKIDIHEPNFNFVIEEDASEVDGKHVLAKIKGEFFCPDGYSRNKRFYPKALWEKVLNSSDVKKELKNRTMFGCISHSTPLNDESFRDGKFSHIVTKMYIEDGKGMGEALILNTPTGQILNTVARAGSKLFVSTRADGRFEGETSEGTPIVDGKSYKYHTTDFVLRPGFLQANPELAEAFNKIKNSNEENDMGNETLLKSLTEENGNLKVDISEISKSYETLKTENADTLSENVSLKEEIDRLLKVEKEAKEISETLEVSEKELKEYKEIDTPENINNALNLVEEKVDAYMAVGTLEVVEANKKMSEEVETLGGMDSINKVIDIAESFISEKEEGKTANEISELAKELNVSEEKITSVYGKLTNEEIKDLFKGMGEKEEEDDKEDKEDKEDDKEDNEDLKEDHEDDADIEDDNKNRPSRCASLMEGFSRGF